MLGNFQIYVLHHEIDKKYCCICLCMHGFFQPKFFAESLPDWKNFAWPWLFPKSSDIKFHHQTYQISTLRVTTPFSLLFKTLQVRFNKCQEQFKLCLEQFKFCQYQFKLCPKLFKISQKHFKIYREQFKKMKLHFKIPQHQFKIWYVQFKRDNFNLNRCPVQFK